MLSFGICFAFVCGRGTLSAPIDFELDLLLNMITDRTRAAIQAGANTSHPCDSLSLSGTVLMTMNE